MTGEFNTYWYYDEIYHKEAEGVDAETAIHAAERAINSVAGRSGLLTRVIITDGGDFISFEWIYGKGITFPKSIHKIN